LYSHFTVCCFFLNSHTIIFQAIIDYLLHSQGRSEADVGENGKGMGIRTDGPQTAD